MTQCRFCRNPLTHEFIDLLNAPPSNSFLRKEKLNEPEVYFPLKLYLCEKCFLVQIDEYKSAGEIFDSEYVYFSSYSRSWLAHCEKYADLVTSRFGLTAKSKIVEVASNDGYLLQFFKQKGFSVLGVEPTRGTAEVAIQKGIETSIRFFGKRCADELVRERGPADLIIANNVLAHVPDINDLLSGVPILLSEKGVFTAEFPHLLNIVQQRQFDTIYHEHFSYLSFTTTCAMLKMHGLRIFDVQKIPTHGGSLRIFAERGSLRETSKAVEDLLSEEKSLGMTTLGFYSKFQEQTDFIKNRFLQFLLTAKLEGRKTAAYGAAAKGNTLLNYCGVKRDLIEFVVDASPHKQGLFLPGSHVPVVAESKIRERKPDYVILFPWNLRTELVEQLQYIREWEGKFVIALPELEIF